VAVHVSASLFFPFLLLQSMLLILLLLLVADGELDEEKLKTIVIELSSQDEWQVSQTSITLLFISLTRYS